MLTRVFINKLKDRKQRSAIINVSSVTERSPLGFMGPYAATKRLVSFFSSGLNYLYKNNIDVLNVVPGYVTTKMTNFNKTPSACSPEVCVKNSLKSLGYDFEVLPFMGHIIFGQVFHSFHRYAKPLWRSAILGELEKMSLKNYYKRNQEQK